MDALATGTTTIVNVTQPLATPQSMAAIAAATPGRHNKAVSASVVQRALPIQVEGSTCRWRPIDVRHRPSDDDMVVELSSPLTNPYRPSEAGMFVRVSLGGQHESWYWISLVPAGGKWGARFVSVLPR